MRSTTPATASRTGAEGRGRTRTSGSLRAAPGWTRSPYLPVLSVLVVLLVMETASRTGIVSPEFFPPVSQDFAALARMLVEPGFWAAVADTLLGWAAGLASAAIVAVPLGILLGAMPLVYQSVRAIIEFMRPVPSVALIPLAVLIFGSGMPGKLFLVIFASFWPVLVQTIYGVRDVDSVADDTARSFGFGRLSRLRRVTFPSALPYIATGLRISSAVALIIAVTAEIVIGAPGIGREMNLAREGGAFDRMYAFIIASGLIGWLLNSLFVLVERRVMHWHVSQRGSTR